MTMSKKEREKYFNPDGSIKRLLEVVEIRPDGTKVFENGWISKPATVDFGDGRGKVRLDSLTPEERQNWERGLMDKVGRSMSAFYQARDTGAGKYS